jgi:c-di-GMP-binding flagellar brake protein YcgR
MDKPKTVVKPKRRKFDVKIETMVPATLKFRVEAFDEKEALGLIKNARPIEVKYNLLQRRDLKAIVYAYMSTIILLVKNLRS